MTLYCHDCEQPQDGTTCIPDATVEQCEYHRIPYNASGTQRCHGCGTPRGGYHHSGCDRETCPRCLRQAIGCGCRWEDSEPPEDEHPNARRVTREEHTP